MTKALTEEQKKNRKEKRKEQLEAQQPIKRGTLIDLQVKIKDLPTAEPSRDDVIEFNKIFTDKDFMDNIKGAIIKGYTFSKIAKVCQDNGVNVTARQLQYHLSRNAKSTKKRTRKPHDSGDVSE